MTLPEPSRNRQVLARGAQLLAATLLVLAPTVLCAGSMPALGDRVLLAQNTTTDTGTTEQGTAAAPAASGGVNANTSAAAEGGVNANTSAAGAAEEQPQAPRQPAVETTPFGLTIYRGSGSL